MSPTESELTNPFYVWSDLTRGLRDRFVAELGPERPFSPYTGELLGQLATLVTRCEHIGTAIRRLAQLDPPAYEAFLRALEKSGEAQ